MAKGLFPEWKSWYNGFAGVANEGCFMTSIGDRLRYLREQRGLSQLEAARLLGINNSVLSRIDNGKRSVEDELLVKFSRFYRVSTDYILGRTDDPCETVDFPQTAAPYLPEGFEDLPEEAKKEVYAILEYVLQKYKKK